MNLKELEKQAYDMMLLNPNSEQYRQIRAYINQIKDKEMELTKEFAEKLKNQANDSLQDSDIEDEYSKFFNEGRDYGAD
jgi:thiaminase